MIPASSLPDFSRRATAPEIMDDGSSSERDLYLTLGHFASINRLFSRSAALFCRFIVRDIHRRGLTGVTIMDVGAGGGDFARWCSKFLTGRSVHSSIICLDHDPRVVSYLRQSCRSYPNIEIVHGSVFDPASPPGAVDYCVSNNVMHHMSDDRVPDFIASMRRRARFGFLINDIARSFPAYVGFKVFAGIFMRGGFTMRDGLTSIRKGFTRAELERHVGNTGLALPIKIGRAAIGNIYIVGIENPPPRGGEKLLGNGGGNHAKNVCTV
jgi:2-polyprenyl-3-methyl-5-hydroxy-6-metoxy-1,4-benzoquinol methylase